MAADQSPITERYFGLAHLKEEGAPMHPDDCYIKCGCAKCEKVWQRQLKAYNDHYANR